MLWELFTLGQAPVGQQGSSLGGGKLRHEADTWGWRRLRLAQCPNNIPYAGEVCCAKKSAVGGKVSHTSNFHQQWVWEQEEVESWEWR